MPLFEINLPKSITQALGIPPRSPKRSQMRVLKKLLRRARYTAFGQQFGFEHILQRRGVAKRFQEAVP
ncbi:MAG: GH3 family domain-containing protein, partial [Sediminibacterium sp.]